MAKYDSQLQNVKTELSKEGSILVAIPANSSVDKIAAGLSLYLALKNSGKEVSIVSPDTLTVSQSNLFGVGEVQASVPAGGEGNFVISLEGVVDTSTGNPIVSSLEKLDWMPEGNNLNLVFHIAAGKKFEPTKVNQFYQNTGSVGLIFVVGAPTLNDLGIIYQNHQDVFSKAHIVNIDNNGVNTNFGATNIVDTDSATLSEIVLPVITDLGLSVDQDIASNALTGIYDATANLTTKTSPETFIAVGQAMQAGGKTQQVAPSEPQAPFQVAQEPQVQIEQATPPVQPTSEPVVPQSAPVEQPQEVTPQAISADQVKIPQGDGAGFDLRQIFNIPGAPGGEQFTNPPVVNPADSGQANLPQHSSPEERPTGEYATSTNPEVESAPTPDWLVPKIFKGGNLG